MRLTPAIVGDVLAATLGYRVAMSPLGFAWRSPPPNPRRARLQRGSGIAGRGDVWALVQLPDGTPIETAITTKAALTRVVLEFMAGPPPRPLRGYTMPRAKRVIRPRTGEAHFAWVCRRRKQRGARVALVPFGSALR